MVCKKCGNELKENMAFCNKCGAKVKQGNKYNYYDEIIDIENLVPEDIDINMLLSRNEEEGTISLENVVGQNLKRYGYKSDDAYYVICAFDEKYPNDFIKFKEIEKKYSKIYSELKNTASEGEYESKRRTIEVCRKIELHNITLLMLHKIEDNWKSLIKFADNLIKNGETNNKKIDGEKTDNEKLKKENRILNIIIIGGIVLIVVIFLIINYAGKTNSVSSEIQGLENASKMVICTMILMLVIFAIAICVYLIPTFVACKKKHPYTTGIVLINIFLGWILIGWVGALVWACCVPGKKQSVVVREVNQTNKYDDIKKLQELKDMGAITEEEFDFEKAKILNK